MAWVWTKQWSSVDDGTIWSGNDVQNIQTDIVNNAVDLTSTQVITGAKTFSGSVVFTGELTNVAKLTEYVFYDDDLVSYEDEPVIYQ